MLDQGRYRNVLFNLDQCGHSHVQRQTLLDIMRSYHSVEIFYTFAIEALVSFLQKSDPVQLAAQLRPFDIDAANLGTLNGAMSKSNWLGAAERLVFETFRTCAPFVSPFSINNPTGGDIG
ncbi:three-Cys-motif partner protein TcmP [Citricoccus parietis]|uniref:Three-Cys-motif partner protein TcmP n=1 Tax=Citricoccus parietis TaxID=592307 RepID=A0ABV5GA03_9MICC